jgi:hypothetical protein
MDDLERNLAAGLKKQHGRLAKLIGDRMTTVRPYPAPWLPSGTICDVRHMAVRHPVAFFAAVGPDGRVWMLTDDPDAFTDFTRAQGVHLADRQEAADYVRALLETTRSMSKLVYVLDDVSGIKFRPAVDEREQARGEEFVDTYRDVIRPPSAEPVADGWEVEAFVVVDQRVQRDRVDVTPAGTFRARFEVLADDLPLAVGR